MNAQKGLGSGTEVRVLQISSNFPAACSKVAAFTMSAQRHWFIISLFSANTISHKIQS